MEGRSSYRRCISESTLCPRGLSAHTGWELKKHLLNERTAEGKEKAVRWKAGHGRIRGGAHTAVPAMPCFYRQMAAHGTVQPWRLPGDIGAAPHAGLTPHSRGSEPHTHLLRVPERKRARHTPEKDSPLLSIKSES